MLLLNHHILRWVHKGQWCTLWVHFGYPEIHGNIVLVTIVHHGYGTVDAQQLFLCSIGEIDKSYSRLQRLQFVHGFQHVRSDFCLIGVVHFFETLVEHVEIVCVQ